MPLRFQPVRVAVDEEGQGLLVFYDDHLVAVLSRLSSLHAEVGEWYFEAGLGKLDLRVHPTFDSLEAAGAWIRARLAAASFRGTT